MELTYKSAGVDKTEGYKEVNLIKQFITKTYNKNVLSELGGFSALYELNKEQFRNPVLVSGTDGVGTKVKISQILNKHDTIGIDCVAMCVNDILCQGATPLFFLDYIATGKLVAEKMADIVKGIADGCMLSNCALIGGETAEMPGIYKKDDYDIAGFCVGIVEKDKIINGVENVKKGNKILAFSSSGVHSNGFSLIRKILDYKNISLDTKLKNGNELGFELLKPTRIYVKEIKALMEKINIKGISHITGGGIFENIPRVLAKNLNAKIYKDKIPKKEIFTLLQKWGDISEKEMYETFNMGIGMVIFIDSNDYIKVKELFGDDIYEIGEVIDGENQVVLV